jgi:hypothetical protein
MPYLELNHNGVANWDHVTRQVSGLGFLPIIMAAVSAGSAYLKAQQAKTASGIAKGQSAGQTSRDELVATAQAKLDAANAAKAAADAVAAEAAGGGAEAQADGGGGGGGTVMSGNATLYIGLGALTLVALALATRR